jgi:hypothetical protein
LSSAQQQAFFDFPIFDATAELLGQPVDRPEPTPGSGGSLMSISYDRFFISTGVQDERYSQRLKAATASPRLARQDNSHCFLQN